MVIELEGKKSETSSLARHNSNKIPVSLAWWRLLSTSRSSNSENDFGEPARLSIAFTFTSGTRGSTSSRREWCLNSRDHVTSTSSAPCGKDWKRGGIPSILSSLVVSFQHTGYSSSPYNGLYAHPYPNPLGYGPYLPDTLSYPTRTASSHSSSSTNGMISNEPCVVTQLIIVAPQCLFHLADSNGFSSPNGGNPSMPANATSSSNHHRHRSPVYNASNNSGPAMGTGGSHGRSLNNGGSKRRLTGSHGHTNSYVNNTSMSKSIYFA